MSAICQNKSITKQVTRVSSENDQEDTAQDIDKLQSVGINAADIVKLKGAGICTVLGIIQSMKKEMCNIKGLSEVKVEKIVEAANKLHNANDFINGANLLIKRQRVLKLHSGSNELDQLLGGGFESMSIIEMFGENRTGKTQLCHTLCVTAQLPCEEKGGGGKVCYIDTEGTFRPEKIVKIAQRFTQDPEVTLENIIYARAYNTEHMLTLIAAVASRMCTEKFSLLVVDSIIALFRTDYSGRGELSERQQKLNKMLSCLMKLAEQFNLAVVITNHVMSDPGGTMSFNPNPTKPVGGHVLGHASTTRISLRKGKGDQRIAKIYDSPSQPESECIFQLSDSGVIDTSD